MFKLNPAPTFKAKVSIPIPGQAKPADIDVEFKHLSAAQRAEVFGNLDAKTKLEFVSELVVGWSGVDQAFSAKALEALLDNYPAATTAIIEAFNREFFGARAKN